MKLCRVNWKWVDNNPKIKFSEELTEEDKLIHDAVCTLGRNEINPVTTDDIWYCCEILKQFEPKFKEMFERNPEAEAAEIEIEGVKMKGVVQDESTPTV